MGAYDDILNHPRHVSAVHPPMPMEKRAAQFSPFAALTGYGEVIAEAARLTDRRVELTDSEKEAISRALASLTLPAPCEVTYFIPDARKDGGRYATETVTIRRVEPGQLLLADGRAIPLEDVVEVETPRP